MSVWESPEELERAKCCWDGLLLVAEEHKDILHLEKTRWMIERFGAHGAYDRMVAEDVPQMLPDDVREVLLLAYRYYEHTLRS